MAESYENILMWSHYADQHQGICLGYKTHEAKNEIYKVCYNKNKHKMLKLDSLSSWIEQTKLSQMKRNHNSLSKEYIDICFLNKNKEWNYENEWRLISNEGSGEKHTELELCEVCFGYRVKKEIKDMLCREIDRLYKNDVAFYQMIRIDNSYFLKREKYQPSD